MSDPRKRVGAHSYENNEPASWDRWSGPDAPVAASLARDMSRLKKVETNSWKKPRQTRIFAVANQKGGVGKTTSVVNIAAAMASNGLKVLVVDADPQGNASTALGFGYSLNGRSLYEAMRGDLPFSEVVYQNQSLPSLFVVPSTIDLAAVDLELNNDPDRLTRLSRILDEYLEREVNEGERFDYVFIDCPPSMSLLPINALVAADEVMIPVQAEYYALEGLNQLNRTIETARSSANPDLSITTILITMVSQRTNLSADVAHEVREYFAGQVLDTEIPRSIRVAEAPSYGETVITYAPRSSAAIAYLSAAQEITERAE